MRRIAIPIALLVLVVLGVILELSFRSSSPSAHPDSGSPPASTRSAYASTTQFVPSALQRLHSPETDGKVDVSAIQAVLSGLAQSLQGNLPPIGDDRDLARALLGRNRDGLPHRPPSRPLGHALLRPSARPPRLRDPQRRPR